MRKGSVYRIDDVFDPNSSRRLFNKKIIERLRKLRFERGMTQQDVASKSGINYSYYNKIESLGTTRSQPSLPTLLRICNALGTSLDYLLSGEFTNEDSIIDEILVELRKCSPHTRKTILEIVRVLVKSEEREDDEDEEDSDS